MPFEIQSRLSCYKINNENINIFLGRVRGDICRQHQWFPRVFHLLYLSRQIRIWESLRDSLVSFQFFISFSLGLRILPYDPQETLSALLTCFSSSCTAFLSIAWRTGETIFLNRVTSLLSMRVMCFGGLG